MNVHGVCALNVKHEFVTVLAAQLVRVTACVDKYFLISSGNLADRKSRGRVDLTQYAVNTVALKHTLSFAGRCCRVY